MMYARCLKFQTCACTADKCVMPGSAAALVTCSVTARQHSDGIGTLAPEQRCGEPPEASILRLHVSCGTCPVGLCKQVECGNDDCMVIHCFHVSGNQILLSSTHCKWSIMQVCHILRLLLWKGHKPVHHQLKVQRPCCVKESRLRNSTQQST